MKSAIDDGRTERIVSPSFVAERNGVEVGGEHESGPFSLPLEPCHDIGPAGGEFVENAVEAGLQETIVDNSRHVDFAARRIAGVHPDQRLQKFRHAGLFHDRPVSVIRRALCHGMLH